MRVLRVAARPDVVNQHVPTLGELTDDARKDIPSTLICTGFTVEQYRTYAKEHPEWASLAGIPELRNASWIDLPTSHWPMWSRPKELAAIIGDVAKAHAPATRRPIHPRKKASASSRSARSATARTRE